VVLQVLDESGLSLGPPKAPVVEAHRFDVVLCEFMGDVCSVLLAGVEAVEEDHHCLGSLLGRVSVGGQPHSIA
jgi:hypothetical protein